MFYDNFRTLAININSIVRLRIWNRVIANTVNNRFLYDLVKDSL